MTERKYSISEIDTMREAVRNMFPITSSPPKSNEIEERLRTHMLNGTDPAELAEAATEFFQQEFKRLQEWQEAERQFREKSERTGA